MIHSEVRVAISKYSAALCSAVIPVVRFMTVQTPEYSIVRAIMPAFHDYTAP